MKSSTKRSSAPRIFSYAVKTQKFQRMEDKLAVILKLLKNIQTSKIQTVLHHISTQFHWIALSVKS